MRARHCARTLSLAGRNLELADRLSLHHVAADTPTGMKANETVCGLGERIAKQRQRHAVIDAIGAVEIAEHDGIGVRRDIRHVDCFNHRSAKDRRRIADGQ